MTSRGSVQAGLFAVIALLITDLALISPRLQAQRMIRKESTSKFDVVGPSPTFSPAVAYSTGAPGAILNGENNTVAIADVNGDGSLDLLVADYCGSFKFLACPRGEATGMVSVLLGNGDGTFQSARTYPSGGFYAVAVLVADVNNDGKPDLIMANGCTQEPDACPTEGSVGVLHGNGDGTFQPVQILDAGGVPYAMALGDLNKDGRRDVIVANRGGGSNGDGSVGVFLGTGSGSLQSGKIYDSGGMEANFVVVADINNDDNPDVLVTNLASCQSCPGNLGVLLGNGDGTLKKVVTYNGDGLASGLVVADMNQDGMVDVVVNEGGVFNGGIFSILLGNGDGTFQPSVMYSSMGDYNYFPSVADLNGDEQPDVIVPNGQFCSGFKSGAGCVAVFLGNGNGTLQTPALLGASGGAGWVDVSDLNGDGIPDVVFVGQGGRKGGYVGVLEGNGDGTFQTAQVYGTGGFHSTWVGVMDLNGDGKPDLLVENPNAGTDGGLGVLLNSTPFCTAPPVVTISVAPTSLWPPNGKMAPVTISGTITDTGCSVTNAAYVVTDEYGEVQPMGAVTLGGGGVYSFTILLQASRHGTDLYGRLYTITVSASNDPGKTGSSTATVIVPHNRRH